MDTKNQKTILVIEDEATHRNALHDRLAKKGFRMLSTGDGEEGLTLAKQERPEFIVLDLLLPGMNGLDLLETLRNDPEGASVPVLILTAYDLPEYRERAEKLKVAGYLVKTNWQLDDLVGKICRMAESSHIKISNN